MVALRMQDNLCYFAQSRALITVHTVSLKVPKRVLFDCNYTNTMTNDENCDTEFRFGHAK